MTFDLDGTPFVAQVDNIDKARIVPDWAALGLAPSREKKENGRATGATRKANHTPRDNKRSDDPSAGAE